MKKKEEKEEGKVNRRGGWWGNEGNREREQSDGVERRKTAVHDIRMKKTVEGSCDAGIVDERSILLITANHGGVGVSQGPRLAFFPLIGNEAQLPCSGPSRKGLDCCRSLGPARCDKFDGIAVRARGAGGF